MNDDYKVIVNKEKFIEEGVPGQRLADFEGRRIFLPSEPKYRPERDYRAGIASDTASPAARWYRQNPAR